MKTIKKIVSLLIIAALLTGCASTFGVFATAFAADLVKTGSCGETVTYTLDSDGVLIISGSGAMWGYMNETGSPFYADESIKTVVIEQGVTSIGSEAFYGCTGLASVTISDSVTTIGSRAFYFCSGLTSLTIPASVVSMRHLDSFCGCSGLEQLEVASGNPVFHSEGNCIIETETKTLILGCKNSIIPDDGSVTSIGLYAFCYNAGVTGITIPDNITSIDGDSFVNCTGLTGITIPASVTSIREGAFHGCSGLETMEVAAGNPTYHSAGNCIIETETKTLVFGCKNSVIPDDGSVTSIGCFAFWRNTALESIVIPESVTSVGRCAFLECSGLKNLTIQDGVNSIDLLAFSCCTELESIVVSAGNQTYRSAGDCLIETGAKKLILGCKNSVIPDDGSITSIDQFAFYGCTGLTRVTIPDSVTTINNEAFYGCTGLTSIIIPNTITNIGASAFEACTGLTSITIRDGVTSIKEHAFCGCGGLTSIVLPDSVTEVGDSAFAFCAGLEKIWIPETTVKIGNNVFLIENEEPVYDLPEIDFGFGGSEDEVPEWNDLSSTHPENLTIHGVEGSYAQTYAEAHDIPFIANVYNLGEETYSFKNYIDDDSEGHCFGMAITSSGYYLGILDKSAIGIELPQELYTVPGTQTTKDPICYYQHIQGNYTHFALVAGSTTYYNSGKTSEQCWNETVDYVKSHRFDNMGNLQIQIWKTVTNEKTRENEESGHAVNFLYYKNVEGQDRLYAYDNNYPNTEVYFYLGENGKIYEAPRSTYGNTYTDTICLVDMDKYFEAAQNYRSNRYVYAKAGDVEIDAATAYPMACAGESMVMYEIPANLTQIVIKPMVDDAKIEYMDHTYCFGKLEEEKIGVLTLAESDDEASFGSVTFTVVDAQESHDPNCACGQYHSGPFAVLIKFFHQIIYFFKNLFR